MVSGSSCQIIAILALIIWIAIAIFRADSNNGVLAKAYTLNWLDPWEPFYIINSQSPPYDERFKQVSS